MKYLNLFLIYLWFFVYITLLFNSDSKLKYYTIILFVFQFICLMIFLELLELNFCNLNKNTKRNIQLRAENDMNEEINRESVFEIEPGYEIDENDGKLADTKKTIEMV